MSVNQDGNPKGEPESYLGMLQGVAAARDEWTARVRQSGLGPRLAEEVVKARVAEKRPMVGREDLMEWGPHLNKLGDLLVAALADHEETAALAAGLRLALVSGRLEAGLLAGAALAGDAESLAAWAEENGLHQQQLAFVAAELAGPPIRLMGEGWLDAGTVQSSGDCLVCGQEPLLARLDAESGARWLVCSLCASQYRVARLGCAFCGNSGVSTLGYLVPEDGPRGWRIDYCERCGRYIKTLDERGADLEVTGPFVLMDAATLHLDTLAQSLGYGVEAAAAAGQS